MDSKQWKLQFELHTGKPMRAADRDILRSLRTDTFRETVSLARQGWYLSEEGNKVLLPDPKPMAEGTRLFSKRISAEKKAPADTLIRVENMDCLVCARQWLKQGYKTAVLNMASRRNPGGGVATGAGAQEENLFRRSSLFQSLYQFVPYAPEYGVQMRFSAYPLDPNHGGIYSPGVTVFRGTEAEGYPLLSEYYQVDVISVPGMNRPQLNAQGRIEEHLVEGVKNKMRTIFNIALLGGNDCLILGALGCGAFRNPPEQIAELFHELLETEYKNAFKVIVFAILDDHNAGKEHNREGNYRPFAREFMGCAKEGGKKQ